MWQNPADNSYFTEGGVGVLCKLLDKLKDRKNNMLGGRGGGVGGYCIGL
jgi:hypothetical protein